MQSSEKTPSDSAPKRADLSRLRIDRGDESQARVKGFPWIGLTLALGVLAVLFLLREPLLGLVSGSGGETVKLGRATRIVPGQAGQGDVAANGYIIADTQASLASVLSGRLVELHAKEGDEVGAGAVVARIQYDDLEVQERQAAAARRSAEAMLLQVGAQYETAKARVVEAEKDHAAAELTTTQLDAEIESQQDLVASATENRDRLLREVERNRKLYEDKRINAAEWDRIQTAARSATNELDAAKKRMRALEAGRVAWSGQIARRKAAWDVAKRSAESAAQAQAVAAAGLAEAREAEKLAAIMVEKTRIRSPFKGLVIRKDAEIGEVIAPMGAGNSRGSVLTVVDPESFEVQVELSERRIGSVNEGDSAMVFLDADPETALPGTVRKIWPRADRSKGSIELRVTLEKRPANLRPDMAARVVFKGKAQAGVVIEPYVTVPTEAVVMRSGKSVVFVFDRERVRAVAVVKGKLEGRRVRVTEGLEGNEQIVLAPAASLSDGDRVQVAE
jgi:RND family efflux transporter MFP subunit